MNSKITIEGNVDINDLYISFKFIRSKKNRSKIINITKNNNKLIVTSILNNLITEYDIPNSCYRLFKIKMLHRKTKLSKKEAFNILKTINKNDRL